MRYLAHRIYMHIHLKSRYNSKIKYKHMLLHNFFKAINLENVLNEVLLSMRRAGADCIITYFTPLILDMLQPKSKY